MSFDGRIVWVGIGRSVAPEVVGEEKEDVGLIFGEGGADQESRE